VHAGKVLIVYYTRTGTTGLLADAIAKEMHAGTEELTDTTRRTGPIGWLRSGFDARLGRLTVLKTVRHDPADYDLVIVGTPVWAGSISPAVRTYLYAYQHQFKSVAFFCTHGAARPGRVFQQMTEACRHAPIDVLSLRADEVTSGHHFVRVREFVDAITHTKAAA
jgi:menaquinone-dependent protoporphyrinogen IX oxidase